MPNLIPNTKRKEWLSDGTRAATTANKSYVDEVGEQNEAVFAADRYVMWALGVVARDIVWVSPACPRLPAGW